MQQRSDLNVLIQSKTSLLWDIQKIQNATPQADFLHSLYYKMSKNES